MEEQHELYGAQLWVSLLDNSGVEASLQQQLIYLVQAYNSEVYNPESPSSAGIGGSSGTLSSNTIGIGGAPGGTTGAFPYNP